MDVYPHWDRIKYKLENEDGEKLDRIQEVRDRYKKWRGASEAITGSSRENIVAKTVEFNDYKNFIQKERYDVFSAQSQLRSSALEEFYYYLFNDLVENLTEENDNFENSSAQASLTTEGDDEDLDFDESVEPDQVSSLYMGKGNNVIQSFELEIPTDEFDFLELIERDSLDLDITFADHDFVIGREIGLSGSDLTWDLDSADQTFVVPAVIIECKAYFDKPMFRRANDEASELTRLLPYKPNFYLTSEYVKHSSVDLSGSDIENLYILRKQKQIDQKDRRDNPDWPDERNDIQPDLVWDLYCEVEKFLESTWRESEIWRKGKFY